MNYDENNVESNTVKADKTKFAHFSHGTKNSVLLFDERKIILAFWQNLKLASVCIHIFFFWIFLRDSKPMNILVIECRDMLLAEPLFRWATKYAENAEKRTQTHTHEIHRTESMHRIWVEITCEQSNAKEWGERKRDVRQRKENKTWFPTSAQT